MSRRKSIVAILVILLMMPLLAISRTTVAAPKHHQIIRAYIAPIKCHCKDSEIDHGAVHIVYDDGQDQQVTKYTNALKVQVADDNQTVAWTVGTHINTAHPDIEAPSIDDIMLATKLVIYKDHKVIQKIDGGWLVRGWKLLPGSQQVALELGALHFAGTMALYNIGEREPVEIIDEANQPRPFPTWTKGLW